MKYEIKKVFSNSKIIMLVMFFLLLNGITIINICARDLPDYTENYSYSQQDINQICDNANEQIYNKQNVKLMNMIIKSFSSRKWNYSAYDSREFDYINNNLSIYMMILLTVIITSRLFGAERENNMNKIISVIPSRMQKLYNKKLLFIMCTDAVIAFIFFIEELLLYTICGGVYPSLKLYLVPGYITSWFSGSIFMYKVISLLINIVLLIVISEIVYIICFFIQSETASVMVSYATTVLLIGSINVIPKMFRYLNPFSIINNNYLSRYFSITKLSDHYFYTYVLAAIITFLYGISLYIISLLVSRKRGVI